MQFSVNCGLCFLSLSFCACDRMIGSCQQSIHLAVSQSIHQSKQPANPKKARRTKHPSNSKLVSQSINQSTNQAPTNQEEQSIPLTVSQPIHQPVNQGSQATPRKQEEQSIPLTVSQPIHQPVSPKKATRRTKHPPSSPSVSQSINQSTKPASKLQVQESKMNKASP